MLHRAYGFQLRPVLEPDDLGRVIRKCQSVTPCNSALASAETRTNKQTTYILGRDPRPKRLVDILVDLGPHLRGQISVWILFVHVEREFCPDAEMHDALVDAVGPVVVDDLDVVYRGLPKSC